MKFKEGQLVKIKTFEKRPRGWVSSGLMDHMMGKILPISYISMASNGQCLYIYDELYETTWCFLDNEVEPVTEKIMIYRDGQTVIAKNLATGENAIAKCSPEDKFNFETGAKLAFDRLTGEKQALTQPVEKVYNGKLCCIKGYKNEFTVGKIYEVKDGRFKNDKGETVPYAGGKFRDMDHIKDYFTPDAVCRMLVPDATTIEFIEVVE